MDDGRWRASGAVKGSVDGAWRGEGIQYSTMEAYHTAALLSELDVQAKACRSGGGAAERLQTSGGHLVEAAEIEERERGQAAQCSHTHVCHLAAAVAEVESLQRSAVAHR